MSVSTWYNVILTVDTGSGRMYLNGIESTSGSQTINQNWVVSSINGYANYHAAGFDFIGNIDEVSFYNYALDSATALSIGGTVPTDLSLLATPPINYYKMGENATFLTNWTVPDSVGSNTGTSANMTIEDRVGEAPNSENNAVSLNMDFADVVLDTP